MNSPIEKNMTEIPPIFDIISQKHWEATPERELMFSSDHLIDAYVKGKNEGLNSEKKLIGDKIIDNVKISGRITAEILDLLKSEDIEAETVFLKIVDWNEYEIMFVIPSNALLGDKILEIYSQISSIEESVKSEYYNPLVSLCAGGAHFNEKCVTSDGFNIKLNLKAND